MSADRPTLYSLILTGLIEWAGESADLDDCRDAARHLTPLVRGHIEKRRAELERRIQAGPSCGDPWDHEGCYLQDALMAVRNP